MNTPSNQQLEKKPVGRPHKVLTVVPVRVLVDRAIAINQYHNNAAAAYAQASFYAVMCGMELMAARTAMAHGEWLPWVEKNCEFEKTAAYKYMMIAEKALPLIQKHYPVLGDGSAIVAPSLMKKNAREKFIAAVSEMTDGQTIQELQLELGIIKQKPEPNLGGSRPGAGRPTKLEKTVADQMMAFSDWEAIAKQLCPWVVNNKWAYLDKKQLDHVRDVLRGALDTIEKGVGK
jgi:Protein of unknown function (DUF3102)